MFYFGEDARAKNCLKTFPHLSRLSILTLHFFLIFLPKMSRPLAGIPQLLSTWTCPFSHRSFYFMSFLISCEQEMRWSSSFPRLVHPCMTYSKHAVCIPSILITAFFTSFFTSLKSKKNSTLKLWSSYLLPFTDKYLKTVIHPYSRHFLTPTHYSNSV